MSGNVAASGLLAACAAFYHWSISGSSWQGLLALTAAAALLLLKNEGLFWLLSFAPGLMLVWLPRHLAVVAIAAAALIALR